ncbi:hypothetical protein Tco_1111856 [Tanacetum coccineum]|uniref:Uncharacterized protein n=1 Tax=Tanacetum coccineum TaxID=301880 RepID=A0ABQ5IQM3_9ASTR
MMSDVDVFRPGVLNVVAAKSYGTLVVTVHRDAIQPEIVIYSASVDEMDVLVCFIDDETELTKLYHQGNRALSRLYLYASVLTTLHDRLSAYAC